MKKQIINNETESQSAWDKLIIELAKSLRIDKLLDWILKKMG